MKLSQDTKIRMNGLIAGKSNSDFFSSISDITKDLLDDGFDKEDIKTFITDRVNCIITNY